MKQSAATSQTTSPWDEETTRSFLNLLGVSLDALNIWPPRYVASIFGKHFAWLPLHRYSEFSLLNPWRPLRAAKYLLNVGFPSLPLNPPPLSPPFLNTFFFRPTLVLHRPDHNQDYNTFPDEDWFFINGIMTNDSVAQLNAAFISDLFHRPVTIIQNTTQSLWIDLTECAFGKVWEKEWKDIKEAAAKAFPPIYAALKRPDKNKVVVIAHSQGTIIISGVLAMLKSIVAPPTAEGLTAGPAAPDELTPAPQAAPAPPEFIFPYQGLLDPEDFAPLTLAELAKLEIYCFANCADTMTHYPAQDAAGNPLPWIENYGNENDIVARLGMIAPDGDAKGIRIDGTSYVNPGAYGHMLNEHYLKPIEKAQRLRLKPGGHGKTPTAPYLQLRPDPRQQPIPPRLFAYINGGSPP